MMQSVKTGKSFHPIEPLGGPGDASQSGEPVRNTGSREGCLVCFSEMVCQVKSLLMGRMSLRECIFNCLDFTALRGMIVYKEKGA